MGSQSAIPLRYVLSLLALGLVTRWPGFDAGLWLDEIWTLRLVEKLPSASSILTELFHDNNHPLNSLAAWLLGIGRPSWHYHIMPALAGLGSLALLALNLDGSPARVAVWRMFFIAGSYPMAMYATEARGYSYMLFFCVAAYFSCQRYIAHGGRAQLVLFCLCCVLGFLSHYSFLHFYVACLAWTSWAFYKRQGKSGLIEGNLSLHMVPCWFFLFLYYLQIRRLPEGTGPLAPYVDSVANAFGILLGAQPLSVFSPELSLLSVLLAAASFVALSKAISSLYGQEDDRWVFFAAAVFVSPAIFLSLASPRVLFVRYFLPCLLFAYFLLAELAGRSESRGEKMIAWLLAALFAVGNARYAVDFWRFGRGEDARVPGLIGSAPGTSITVASDQRFRTETVLDFYAKGSIEYVEERGGQEAQWYLKQTQDPFEPFPAAASFGGRSYSLRHELEFAGLSGWRWGIYGPASGATAAAAPMKADK